MPWSPPRRSTVAPVTDVRDISRNVIEVLVERDLDREPERTASARSRAPGARRGLDAATDGDREPVR
jgi:hypothetical protein